MNLIINTNARRFAEVLQISRSYFTSHFVFKKYCIIKCPITNRYIAMSYGVGPSARFVKWTQKYKYIHSFRIAKYQISYYTSIIPSKKKFTT